MITEENTSPEEWLNQEGKATFTQAKLGGNITS